jgi:DNA-binding transcriptional LysR family regulator
MLRSVASRVKNRPTARAQAAPAVELRHLRYFRAVYEELHFGRAAARLRMAQPPLSQAIRKLELELGVQLFERTNRVVGPTEAGRVLAEEARKVLAAFDVAVAEARRAGSTLSPLRISCVPDLPMQPLLRFLDALHERDHGTRARVTHLTFPEQIRGLRVGELDLGIFQEGDPQDTIETEPLFPGERLAAFLRPGPPLSEKPVLRPVDLRSQTLVTFPREANPALHQRLLALIDNAGYRFADVREAGGTDPRDVMLAVAEGLGVAFGPVSLQDVTDVTGIVVCRGLDPELSMPDTVVAWRADPSSQLREVLDGVRDVARRLRADDAVARRT